MRTCAALFAGGGFSTIGMMQAGFHPVWAVEMDADIAAQYRRNIGSHVVVGRVQDVDPATLPSVDLLQASPVCKEFSVANRDRKESDEEREQAAAIAGFVEVLRPPLFVLENVAQYRTSESYAAIIRTLERLGYTYRVAILNAADWGVPQTRKRLIVRAIWGGNPLPPMPPKVERWRGWYDAIADLVPDLPDDHFAPWQIARLKRVPHLAPIAALIETAKGAERGKLYRADAEPAMTVTASRGLKGLVQDGYLIGGGNTNRTKLDSVPRPHDQPAFCVPAHHNTDRAVVAIADSNNEGRALTMRDGADPLFTVTARTQWSRLLLGVQGGGGDLLYGEDDPTQTITSTHGAAKYRVVVDAPDGVMVSTQTSDSAIQRVPIRDGGEPALTVTADAKKPTRAIIRGAVLGLLPADQHRTPDGERAEEDPALTSTAQPHSMRAVVRPPILLNNTNAGQVWGKGFHTGDEPAHTLHTDAAARAMVVDGYNGANVGLRTGDEPFFAMPASPAGVYRAEVEMPGTVVMSGINHNTILVRNGDDPIFCLTDSNARKGVTRATVDAGVRYRVVRLTSRALARLQTVPDWYVLPERVGLATTIIGNGVPCLLMQRIAESFEWNIIENDDAANWNALDDPHHGAASDTEGGW